MASRFGEGNQGAATALTARLGRLIFDHDHYSPVAMVLASVSAAAIVGIGIMAASAPEAPAFLSQTNSPAPLQQDLAHALDAAFRDAPAPTALAAAADAGLAAAAPQTPFSFDTTLLTAPQAVGPAPESPLALAMNDTLNGAAYESLNETEHLTGFGEARNPNASWTAALVPAFTANRLAAYNGTVNVLNNVLPDFEQTVVAIAPGDTMMNLLTDIGIERQDAYYAIEAFGDVYDPRRIRAGQEFNVEYEVLPPVEQGSADDQLRLINLSMRTAPDREVLVRWDNAAEDFVGEARDIELTERFVRGRATIDSSLYLSANDIGVPDAVTVEMIRLFSHSVDFQRDIRQGDSFDVFYSRRYDEDDEPVMMGDVLYASMTTRGRERALYRFTTPDDGLTDYYDEDGQSMRSFLMRTPIDGARISSTFGPRRHPVLGYNRMHKGTDFAAPTGTPIYAAGNGTVVRASRYGSYGNYVRIRHANGYETAYAHLNGYGPGIRSGVRVEQGQVIGYVGATGRVTGAHLHYEVLYNDEQVNPQTIDLPSGRRLEGDVLEAFNEERAHIEAQMAAAPVLEVTATAAAANIGAGATPHSDLSPQ